MATTIKKWDQKVLMLAVQSGIGTPAVPTAGSNAIKAQDVSISTLDEEYVDQHDRAFFGAYARKFRNKRYQIQFTVKLVGSGTAGTAPPMGPAFRASAMDETVVAVTSVTYAPVSSGFEVATIYLNIDGKLYQSSDCFGTCVVTGEIGSPVTAQFTMVGNYAVPTDVALPAANLSAFGDAELFSEEQSTITFNVDGGGNVDTDATSFSIDQGNTTEFLETTEQQCNYLSGRDPSGSVTVWERDVADLDFHAAYDGHLDVALTMTHGITAGNIISVACPKAQLRAPSPTGGNGNASALTIAYIPLPDTGDDGYSFVFT